MRNSARVVALAVLSMLAAVPQPAGGDASPPATRDEALPEVPAAASPNRLGKSIYTLRCLPCHGRLGDGEGPACHLPGVPPADFTQGVFKYHSGVSPLPSDAELFRTVSEGSGLGMPAFDDLSTEERLAVVRYVKSLYHGWAGTDAAHPPDPGPEPARPSDWEARGRLLYESIYKCATCHGSGGEGGNAEGTLRDVRGASIEAPAIGEPAAAALGGWKPRDTVRLLMSGVNGTPMPAFWIEGEETTPLWEVAWYVEMLASRRRDESEVPCPFRRTLDSSH